MIIQTVNECLICQQMIQVEQNEGKKKPDSEMNVITFINLIFTVH